MHSLELFEGLAAVEPELIDGRAASIEAPEDVEAARGAAIGHTEAVAARRTAGRQRLPQHLWPKRIEMIGHLVCFTLKAPGRMPQRQEKAATCGRSELLRGKCLPVGTMCPKPIEPELFKRDANRKQPCAKAPLAWPEAPGATLAKPCRAFYRWLSVANCFGPQPRSGEHGAGAARALSKHSATSPPQPGGAGLVLREKHHRNTPQLEEMSQIEVQNKDR